MSRLASVALAFLFILSDAINLDLDHASLVWLYVFLVQAVILISLVALTFRYHRLKNVACKNENEVKIFTRELSEPYISINSLVFIFKIIFFAIAAFLLMSPVWVTLISEGIIAAFSEWMKMDVTSFSYFLRVFIFLSPAAWLIFLHEKINKREHIKISFLLCGVSVFAVFFGCIYLLYWYFG